MSKTFEVAKYEYTHHVARPRFWIALLSVPVGMVLVMLFAIAISLSSVSKLPVGYVDEAGLIAIPPSFAEKPSLFEPVIPLRPYASEQEARAAAESGSIQAYFVIPEGYESTFQVRYYYNEPLTGTIRNQIQRFLSENLLAGIQVPNQARLEAGSLYTLVSLDGTRSTAENEISKIILPLVVGLLFVIVVLSSGGYLLQAVVEEKENRTMEIMVTSVSPNELMAGKIIGNLSVGLTQILVWALMAVVFVLVMGDRIPFLRQLQISWPNMLLSLLLLLPSFVFTSALMAILGATVTDSQEAAQVTGLITFPILIPYYFFSVLMMHPNGAFSRALSYFPMSAPVAMTMRMAFTQVPAWELLMVIALLVLFSVLTIWLAGKAFRLGMLQYSRRVRLSQLFRKGGAL
ncbi:MAG: ABC transporter permease [Chloroflexi bacterium]|jgi:ABC-2 type transport system permease protein|nr:ABC transporter permease [Anaerolineaceae bacterium]NLI44829.1 ABC transporter permease [Chloroflexota bacterium]HOE35704.1 ABC transporter permease [Anaerolineaceae bacterium]HOT26265.1 ABC transporter permease [Anaerolineaceae bacterium]HQH58210.1 ABC transporter permease [Anaerolineaceae bacterium]